MCILNFKPLSSDDNITDIIPTAVRGSGYNCYEWIGMKLFRRGTDGLLYSQVRGKQKPIDERKWMNCEDYEVTMPVYERRTKDVPHGFNIMFDFIRLSKSWDNWGIYLQKDNRKTLDPLKNSTVELWTVLFKNPLGYGYIASSCSQVALIATDMQLLKMQIEYGKPYNSRQAYH